MYDKVYDPDISTIYDVEFPSISDPPPSVEGIRVEEEIYEVMGRSFVRLRVFFVPPTGYPWFSRVDVYTVVSAVDPDEDDYSYRWPAYDDFIIDPAEEWNNETKKYYYIRLNSVSTYGVKQEDSDSARFIYKVLGVSSVYPPCPTYLDAAVNLSSVDLIGFVPHSPDIAGFEIRLGSTWGSAIFIIFRIECYFF